MDAQEIFNLVVGGQSDTARGMSHIPPDQDAPSRLITLPLSHVKRLLHMSINGIIPDNLDRAIIHETTMRVADIEVQSYQQHWPRPATMRASQ